MPEITVYDAETGSLTVREMTAEEYAHYSAAMAEMPPLEPTDETPSTD